MKLNAIISSLPLYTQVSVLYPMLGSLNASAINAASREVATDLRNLAEADREAVGKSNKVDAISIDRYNELLNELRQKSLNDEHFIEVGLADTTVGEHTKDVTDGFEQVDHINEDGAHVGLESAITHKEKIDRLSTLLEMRAPLLSMFNAAQAKLPQSDNAPDFSFEETLARQLARVWENETRTAQAVDDELVKSGAVTPEELEAVDKKRFEEDQKFKAEFKFLVLDKLRDKEVTYADDTAADKAFAALGWDFGSRMLKRVLPKLLQAKTAQIGRRSFDPDAPTNILIIGLAINEIKKYLGESEAESKLAQLQAALAE